eukprot:scaffold194967_cov19-Tisochrysis_lutea.AAC.1
MSPSTILAKCRNNRDALAPYRLCWCICAQRASRHELRMEFPEGTNHSCMIFQASKQAIAWEKALSWENPDLRAASGMKDEAVHLHSIVGEDQIKVEVAKKLCPLLLVRDKSCLH